MTNKLAPYKNDLTMAMVERWWDTAYPKGKTDDVTIIDLYRSFDRFVSQDPTNVDFINPNQFAKCLVAARIADCGGFWEQLPTWQPKEYEIRRAKVY